MALFSPAVRDPIREDGVTQGDKVSRIQGVRVDLGTTDKSRRQADIELPSPAGEHFNVRYRASSCVGFPGIGPAMQRRALQTGALKSSSRK